MSETLEVASRDSVGKLNNRRLRRSGRLPAVLYGHGKESVKLSLAADDLEATLRHGAKVVNLKGAAAGQALLQDVQWDTFQQYALHVDFLRVEASDRVNVEIALLLRGEAPGEHEGGVVEQLEHVLEIETAPSDIPEYLHLNINDLHLGGELKVKDIEDLPPGAVVCDDPETVLAQCVEPTVEPEEEEMAAAAEPEVIGRAAEEGEEEAAGETEE